MTNPFESGQIKNYLLLYASVVVIMILFFIATTLFNNEPKKIEKRVFNTETNSSLQMNKKGVEAHAQRKFKLLDKAY
jgi:hypothetical protein